MDSLSDCMTYQECLVIVSSLFMHKEVQYSLIMHTLHNTYRTEYTLCILYSITYFNTMNGVKISGHYPKIPCFQTSTLDWFQVENVQTSSSEIMKILYKWSIFTKKVIWKIAKWDCSRQEKISRFLIILNIFYFWQKLGKLGKFW